eukprot:6487702-Amphidinium_carterae.1
MVGPAEYNPFKDPFASTTTPRKAASPPKQGRDIGPPPASIHFKGTPKDNPGPGSYEVSKPIVRAEPGGGSNHHMPRTLAYNCLQSFTATCDCFHENEIA